MADPKIDAVIREIDGDEPEAVQDAAPRPTYRVDEAMRIPVSSKLGAVWQDRIKIAENARKHHVDAWDEAIRYYNHDQSQHRTDAPSNNRAGNRYFAKRVQGQWSETENIVFANVQSLVPSYFAKNPTVEFTTYNIGAQKYVQTIEDLVNTLSGMPHAPGLNLRTHVKLATVALELCNIAWIEVGYVVKEASSEAAIEQLGRISKEYAEAKDQKRIAELEGQLMALDEQLNVLNPSGPYVRFRKPHDVIVDPYARMPDFSDARWIAMPDYIPTDYLNAKYGKKDEATGKYHMVYKPTHVMPLTDTPSDPGNLDNLVELQASSSYTSYGFTSRTQLSKHAFTKCWRIWDKTTRRVYLYPDNDWKWPIWVEDDPYRFPWFFNVFPLFINVTPVDAYARSNTNYILDQQDAINNINSEMNRARTDVKENILFNNKFNSDTVTAWLKGENGTAVGVEVPDGMSLKDMVLDKPNALLKVLPLFDKMPVMQAVDRISGVTEMLRGGQLRTNTTKFAAQEYSSVAQTRMGERVDAVETFLARVMHAIGWVCAMFMQQDEVNEIIGPERGKEWRVGIEVDELRTLFNVQVVGGSTQRPTGPAKQEQALQLADLLSKFIQFAPATVTEIVLTMFQEAFDTMSLPPGTFDRIKEEAMRSQQMNQGGAPGPGGDAVGQIAQAVDQLPPNAKRALGEAIARGVPVTVALEEVIRAMTQSQETSNA